MHDKIKSLLPKEKEIREDFMDFFMEKSRYCQQSYTQLTPDTIGIIIEYYSNHLAEVHAKIPEIVALVEGEVAEALAARDKIKEILK